jgi:phytanoyl-CoA hydroxylase
MSTPPLSTDQVRQFCNEGYVVVPDLLRPPELEPLREEIAGIVDAAARQFLAEGRIADLRESEPFETRLTRLIADRPDCTGAYLRALQGKAGGGHAGRAIYDLITHPRLLDAMECLVGPEIIGSSVYRLRPKVPGLDRGVVPWHQDSGYLETHCDASLIVTCWVPLVDATLENGCLWTLPRVHHRGIATHHTRGPAGYLVIRDEDLPAAPAEAVPLPCPRGGVVLLTNMTPHCSTPNTTDVIRWSVDLRYQGAGAPTNAFQAPEEYDPQAEPVHVACYAPEGDFVVRSRRHPETVHTCEQFLARRAAFEAATLPYPQRGWQPAGG